MRNNSKTKHLEKKYVLIIICNNKINNYNSNKNDSKGGQNDRLEKK